MIDLGQNQTPDKIGLGKFLHPETPHNMYIDSKYVLFEKPDYRTKNQIPGHKNWHKSCQDGTEP